MFKQINGNLFNEVVKLFNVNVTVNEHIFT